VHSLVTVAVTVTPPPGARGESVTVTLDSEERADVDHTSLTWPVAGSFRLDDVTAQITDDDGLFCQTADLDVGVDVAVDPRAPRDVHVGEGGDRIAAGFWRTRGGPARRRRRTRRGPRVRSRRRSPPDRLEVDGSPQPAPRPRVRGQHRPGDAAVFDHRATTADGRPGTRKIDYARQLAVALVDQVGRSDDKLGYCAVGDGGITALIDPGTRADTWRPVRNHLFGVEPTRGASTASEPVRPTVARAASAHLDSDDSAFGRTLAPYFTERDVYRRRFDFAPALSGGQGTPSSGRRRPSGPSSSPTTPTGCAAGGRHVRPRRVRPGDRLPDADGAVRRRRRRRPGRGLRPLSSEFEAFRRELANLEHVSAYEVGPADKLAAVLSVGRDRRRRARA